MRKAIAVSKADVRDPATCVALLDARTAVGGPPTATIEHSGLARPVPRLRTLEPGGPTLFGNNKKYRKPSSFKIRRLPSLQGSDFWAPNRPSPSPPPNDLSTVGWRVPFLDSAPQKLAAP